MAFPEIYREKVNVGSYIPEDKLDNVIAKIKSRINKIVADVRKNLTTITVERETINITLDLAKQLNIVVPVGTTNSELLKINKAIKEEVMVVQVAIPDPVLDQSQELAEGQQWNCKEWQPPYQFCPFAQTFTVGITGSLAKFAINGGLAGGSGTITMQIQATTDGKPNGTVLEQVNFNPADFLTDTWTYIPFSCDLVAGTKYAFVMSFENFNAGDWGPNNNRYNSDTVNAYANGEFLFYVNNVWDTNKNHGFNGGVVTNYSDLMFRTYMLAN